MQYGCPGGHHLTLPAPRALSPGNRMGCDAARQPRRPAPCPQLPPARRRLPAAFTAKPEEYWMHAWLSVGRSRPRVPTRRAPHATDPPSPLRTESAPPPEAAPACAPAATSIPTTSLRLQAHAQHAAAWPCRMGTPLLARTVPGQMHPPSPPPCASPAHICYPCLLLPLPAGTLGKHGESGIW